MQITVNGEITEVEKNSSISDLLKQLNVTAPRVAVECNMNIIPKDDYQNTKIQPNDTIEIVAFVGGG